MSLDNNNISRTSESVFPCTHLEDIVKTIVIASNNFVCFCRELKNLTCKVANTLKSQGVKKGDRVAIYMPVSLEAAAVMLACTRIGAVHRYCI